MGEDDLVERARAHAARLHADDVRKGSGVSYFAGHLEPVAHIVARAGGDPVQVAAAYLHDAAEDHGGEATLADIAERFGDDVAGIVRDLSDSLVDTTTGAEKEAWRTRKRRYVDHLRETPIRSVEVAAADKLHNAMSILEDHARLGDRLWSRFNEHDPAAQLWYYDTLAGIVAERLGPHPTAVALHQTVDRLIAAVGVAPAR